MDQVSILLLYFQLMFEYRIPFYTMGLRGQIQIDVS